MSKYDFGYEIEEGSTIKWAFDKIKECSEVLELGPAVGNLTKHLKEDKNCVIDIVEIDDKAGERASKYARISCIGELGNLEKEFWKERINGHYDYIVALDVLEHLRNAEDVLYYLKSLLKHEGVILLSVPNIAHNSVLINLLNNKFEYNDLGLLDSTHVRFFTRDSLEKMINSCDLLVTSREYIQKLVGDNEIDNQYIDVPEEIEFYLRTRELPDIYQFLYVLSNDKKKCEQFHYNPLYYTHFLLTVYDERNNIIAERSINPKLVEERIIFPKEYKYLRVDILDCSAVVDSLVIEDENGLAIYPNNMIESNGYIVNEKRILFLDNDPQIYLELPNSTNEIKISFKSILMTKEYSNILKKIIFEI